MRLDVLLMRAVEAAADTASPLPLHGSMGWLVSISRAALRSR
jgi:hypothetical protein